MAADLYTSKTMLELYKSELKNSNELQTIFNNIIKLFNDNKMK